MKTKDKIKSFLKNVIETLRRPQVAILPAHLAYYLVLSLVPIITLIGYGASFFNISIETILSKLNLEISKDITDIIIPIFGTQKLDFKLISMIAVTFYLATNAANSIILISNEIYGIKQSSWIRRRIKAIFLTITIIILILFVLIVPLLGEKIIDLIDFFKIKSSIVQILKILQGPISWVIIFFLIKVIYMIAPGKPQSSSRLNIGTFFTTAGWILSTEVYSYYINNMARYDVFYGGLSNIAVLMLWIYLLSNIFVIGMSLNSKVDSNELENIKIDKKDEK